LAIWYAKHSPGKKRAKKPKTKSSGGTAPPSLLQASCSAGAAEVSDEDRRSQRRPVYNDSASDDYETAEAVADASGAADLEGGD
jgi:hypothetical protein